MRSIDYGLQFFSDYCTPEQIAEMSGSAFRECAAILEKRLVEAGLKRGQHIGYQEAFALLHDCRKSLESAILAEVQGYPSIRWLWYLRRLPPDVFFTSDLRTTGPYDSRLAEVICGLGGDPNPNVPPESLLRFKLNGSVGRRLLRLAQKCRFLSTIHSGIRQSSKGVSFLCDGTGLLQPRPTQDQNAGIELFDRRVAEFGSTLDRVGTLLNTECAEGDAAKSVLVFGRLARCEWTKVKGVDYEIHARFGCEFVPLADLGRISDALRIAGHEAWPLDSVLLLLFLRMVMRASPSLPSALSTISQNGYFLVAKDILQAFPQAWLDADMEFASSSLGVSSLKLSPSEVLDYIEGVKPTLWPVSAGRCLQSIGRSYCVDVVSATTHLSLSLEYPPATGEVANVRGEHFELAVQELIDESPLKPPPKIRSLRGRHLKLNGETITDVDALAAKGDVLIIISCKSTVFDAKYDSGDLSSVGNTWGRLEGYLRDALRHQETFAQHRSGDNYDFGDYHTVVVIVCTPYPIYAPPGVATELVLPGLRRYLPSLELKLWLECP